MTSIKDLEVVRMAGSFQPLVKKSIKWSVFNIWLEIKILSLTNYMSDPKENVE